MSLADDAVPQHERVRDRTGYFGEFLNSDSPQLYDYKEDIDGLLEQPPDFYPSVEDASKAIVKSVNDSGNTTAENTTKTCHVGFSGSFSDHHVSPRTLRSDWLGKMISLKGIVTRCSLHEYRDTTSVTPQTDDEGQASEMEYGHSYFPDHQRTSIQAMPERSPPGQLPRSTDVVLDDDLIDKCKPGDRIQLVGVYRSVDGESNGAFNRGSSKQTEFEKFSIKLDSGAFATYIRPSPFSTAHMAPHKEPCDNFESDDENSDADRSAVACKHCDYQRKQHPTTVGSSSKRKQGSRLKGIFDELLAGKDGDEAEDLLESANKEAKAGLKSKNKKQQPKKNRKAGPSSNGKTRPVKVYRLGALFMDVGGTYKANIDGAKVLKSKSTTVPSRRILLEATQRGHAAEFREGLEIPDDASFEEINELIRTHLPKPFEYFDETWDRDYPPFVFASIENRRLVLCQHLLQPTGYEIRSISQGASGKGFESNRLFIVTQKPVPQDVLNSWSPSTIADVDDDDEGDMLQDEPGSFNDDNTDIFEESDLQDNDQEGANNSKGKGKAVAIVRKYRRKVVASDAEESEAGSDSISADDASVSDLRPRKKARIDLTKNDDSDEFELSMAEYNAALSNPGPSSLFLPGTPPSQLLASTVNPQFSDPRPKNDPYANQPDLDF
ncbi:MCM DNA helicase complex subunit [Marasmius crinis-equi]|uniref:DNA replication licensing factor MCM3 n=1 Tax=Marasmius crinis-equi TaxID=585013 RepID=A0ABR3EZF2_9AGAR